MKENFISTILFVSIGIASLITIILCDNQKVNNIAISVFASAILTVFLAITNYITIKSKYLYDIKTIHNNFEYDVKYFVLSIWKHQDDSSTNFWRESVIKLYSICKQEQKIVNLWNEFSKEFYPLLKINQNTRNEAITLFEKYQSIFNMCTIYEVYYGESINMEDTKKYIKSLLKKIMLRINYEEYEEKYLGYSFVVYTELEYKKDKDILHIYAVDLLAQLQDLIKSIDKI